MKRGESGIAAHWGKIDVGKHTAGPWFPIRNEHYWEVRTGNNRFAGEQIGDACSSQYLINGENGEANARVLAAAPEMLEALRMCLSWIERDESTHGRPFGCGNAARAAIAKAEGRECLETFDCANGDHSDCCPATGNSRG